MTELLHIAASPRQEASLSRRVGDDLVRTLQANQPGLQVATRDLATPPLPHPDAAFVAASLMPAHQRGDGEGHALALSETLIAELEAADQVVISTPIHNFTVPSVLKAWIDLVVRPGRTFRTTPEGKVGLLADRQVFVIVACGGRFTGPGAQTDFLGPYLRHVLATIGLTRVSLLRLEALNRGDDARAEALIAARAWIATRLLAHPPRAVSS